MVTDGRPDKLRDACFFLNNLIMEKELLQKLSLWVQSNSFFKGLDAPVVDSQDLSNKIDELINIEQNTCVGCGNYTPQCNCYEISKNEFFNSIR